MKFKSLKMHNFMRYKGDNEILFSTDPEKKCTVITGDNTFGKTTIAQAFRWCLYEDIINTQYTKKSDVILLNKEVLAGMNVNSPEQQVSVEITIEEGRRECIFRRTAYYKRRGGVYGLDVVQTRKTSFTMQERDEKGVLGKIIEETEKESAVSTKVNTLLPQNLSNYLFFDGERWNDSRTKKAAIKASVEAILGLSSADAMVNHMLKNRYNVIEVFRSRISNTSAEMQRISDEIDNYNRSAQDYRNKALEYQKRMDEIEPIKDQLKETLEQNRDTERDQLDLARKQKELVKHQDQLARNYSNFIKGFSQAAKYIAVNVLPDISSELEKIDLSGKDIPGVTVDTIDYLIEHDECLCGTPIKENDKVLAHLEHLKSLIPPEAIGGAAGKLEETLKSWKSESSTFLDQAIGLAEAFQSARDQVDDDERDIETLERRIDRKYNLTQMRNQYKELSKEYDSLQLKKSSAESRAESDERNRDISKQQLDVLASKEDENEDVYKKIEYAKAIAKYADGLVTVNKGKVVHDLNKLIRTNFELMFNGKEKYAKLDQNDWRVHVYYHSLGDNAEYEETNLSNGENIAINYVFIVSVLQLASQYAAEEMRENKEHGNSRIKADETTVLQLPLVLDAPFSNLSNENTELIASRLPEFAEQVIIFMLDKDWEASGLDKYTLPQYHYRVDKDYSKNVSSIRPEGGM